MQVIQTQDLLTSFRGTIDASYEGEVWTRPSGGVMVPDDSSQTTEDPTGDDNSTSDSGTNGSQPKIADLYRRRNRTDFVGNSRKKVRKNQ